jgi:hypothetical protein
MAQGADAQPGEPGEPSDRQQIVIHDAIVNPRAGRESSPFRDGADDAWPGP